MKYFKNILLAFIASLVCANGQTRDADKAMTIGELYIRLEKFTKKEAYKVKEQPSKIIMELFHGTIPEIQFVQFNHSVITEPGRRVELNFMEGVPYSEILRMTLLRAGWHIGKIDNNNQQLIIYCVPKPQTE